MVVSPKVRLCTADQKANSFFLVVGGRVKYSRETASGEEILLRLLTPFECFGLATLLPDPPNYLGTAESLSASEVILWKHTDIVQLADRYAPIKTNVLGMTLEYLGTLCDRHSQLFEGDSSQRVARALIDISRRCGAVNPEGIDVHISNEQLGSLSDVSKFTVSRTLSEWSKKGVISKKREKLRIHSLEALLTD